MANNRIVILIVMLMIVVGSSVSCAKLRGGAAAPPAEDIKLILFITSDGFSSDYVDRFNPPNIQQLIAEGARVQHSRTVFPANTTPNMTALATGSYPKTNGVANNNQYDRTQDRILGGPRADGIKSIAGMLGDAGWTPAAISHFILQNRGVPEEWYFQVEAYTHDLKVPYGLADKVIELVNAGEANFIAVNFGITDTVGHRYGPNGKEIEETVLAVDGAIGRIVEALKAKGIYENTLITMNADHGMSAIEGKNVSILPSVALRNAGFKVAMSQAELADDTEIVLLKGGIRIVYFRKLSEARKQQAIDTLKAIEGIEIYDREMLDALHCHPEFSGDLMLHPKPGYTIEGAGNTGGQHGRMTESNPILFFRGPGIRKGATVAEAENVDIVPTILHLVSVPPAETVDGKVIKGVLAR
jgi:predicted AlkP superfamily pyrophosphatase or phosphodiesterase